MPQTIFRKTITNTDVVLQDVRCTLYMPRRGVRHVAVHELDILFLLVFFTVGGGGGDVVSPIPGPAGGQFQHHTCIPASCTVVSRPHFPAPSYQPPT